MLMQNFVIVGLRGGDASDARSAVAVDLDPGNARSGEWLALVNRGLVDQLAEETGAEVVDAGEGGPWDGARFGDGAGSVEIVEGRLVGTGAYARLSE